MLKQSKILYGGLAAMDRALHNDAWAGAHYTILVDENTFQHCLPLLISNVEALQEADFVEVPTGEDCKTLEVAAQVWQTLLEGGADRSEVLVALGGGTVCDLGGFVAAGYKRGIPLLLVPTTLLAMTDAAIGGKTAIDFGGVKNAVGHFYPASLTVIEPAFLNTLPPLEIECGMMEMVKTAAVTDPALYGRLLAPIAGRPVTKQDIVAVGRIKSRVVKADPYDRSIRKILNFGHTFGHAIEVYSQLPHGLAVGIGMKVAMYLSVRKLSLEKEVYNSYSQWLNERLATVRHPLPTYNLKDIEQMLPLMHQDKKSAEGELRCVLLQELGAPVIDVTVSDNEVRDALLAQKKA